MRFFQYAIIFVAHAAVGSEKISTLKLLLGDGYLARYEDARFVQRMFEPNIHCKLCITLHTYQVQNFSWGVGR